MHTCTLLTWVYDKFRKYQPHFRHKAGGSTNTLGALSLALAAEDTEAVYLLTDGRPDQVLIYLAPGTKVKHHMSPYLREAMVCLLRMNIH